MMNFNDKIKEIRELKRIVSLKIDEDKKGFYFLFTDEEGRACRIPDLLYSDMIKTKDSMKRYTQNRVLFSVAMVKALNDGCAVMPFDLCEFEFGVVDLCSNLGEDAETELMNNGECKF